MSDTRASEIAFTGTYYLLVQFRRNLLFSFSVILSFKNIFYGNYNDSLELSYVGPMANQ